MKNSSKHETLRGWFQLVRLPHLFTVPGDPLIGFLVAGGMTQCADRGYFPIAAVCFISFAMSLFGIVTNDLAEKIAAHYGVETINVLTGFKFIGETTWRTSRST